jgi:hypothetical protein
VDKYDIMMINYAFLCKKHHVHIALLIFMGIINNGKRKVKEMAISNN